jgi:hypothetical protein
MIVDIVSIPDLGLIHSGIWRMSRTMLETPTLKCSLN